MSRRDSKNADQPITELQTFQKYLRFFCMRFVHVVVHSRMGVPLEQPCEANPTTTDWFCFKHDEFGEVAAYLKQSVKKYPPQIPALTVDVFLYTAAGDSLPLESWVVRISADGADENVNTSTTLYRQLGTLLMSACSAARATPAARYYTRSQGEKTYVLCYRVLESEPEADLLGPEYKSILLGNYPCAFGSIQVEFNYRTKMELPLPPSVGGQENHHFTGETDGAGIFAKASIPIKKPLEQRNRLIILSDQKPRAKNWFSPSTEGLPFIADMSRPKNLTPCQSVESEPAIPTLYQNLPAEVLATMPDELKAPKSSECGSARSEISINLKKRESFPFSMLSRDEDETKDGNAQSDSTSLSNFRFPMNANSSSDSSASKRYDSDASTSSSIRETIRQKQRKTDEIFGFLEDDEELDKPIEAKFEPLASSPLQAFIPMTEEIGPELDAFVKEMSMAPRTINSFVNDDLKLLNEQLEYFKQKAPTLDHFITTMQSELTEQE